MGADPFVQPIGFAPLPPSSSSSAAAAGSNDVEDIARVMAAAAAAAAVGFVTTRFFSKLYSRDINKYLVLQQSTHIETQLRA